MPVLPNLPPVVAEHAAAAVACAATPPRALLVADMSEPNRAPRFWAFDLSDPKHPVLVLQSQVAHGYGSDPNRDGQATQFSDVEGSGMTSLGLYRVAGPYVGKHGPSYRLQGLSASNAHASQRDVMLHPAPYVSPARVSYSAGCAAVAPATLSALKVHFGTLTGAALWIDGPGVQAPTCAALEPWAVAQASSWSAYVPDTKACSARS
jgi:hypothetical protein